MKRHIFAALLTATALVASSCNKDPKLPTPTVEEFPRIFTLIGAQSTYKVSDIQGAGNPSATFDINVVGGDASQIEAIEVYRTFRGFNVPTTGTAAVATGGPTVLLRKVPPVSGPITVAVSDIVAGLTRPSGASQTGTRVPVTAASLRSTEGFLFTYALMLKNGRRIEYNASFNTAPFSGIVTVTP